LNFEGLLERRNQVDFGFRTLWRKKETEKGGD